MADKLLRRVLIRIRGEGQPWQEWGEGHSGFWLVICACDLKGAVAHFISLCAFCAKLTVYESSAKFWDINKEG